MRKEEEVTVENEVQLQKGKEPNVPQEGKYLPSKSNKFLFQMK